MRNSKFNWQKGLNRQKGRIYYKDFKTILSASKENANALENMKCLKHFVLFIKEYGEIKHLSCPESCVSSQKLQGGPN